MPILETELARRIVSDALREIRQASDFDAAEVENVEAKYVRREIIAEFEAELLGVNR
jgi:hypothetical protein